MNINIKATGITLTPAISDYVTKRVLTLEKYLDKENPNIVAQVEVGRSTEHHKQGDVFHAEIHIAGGGNEFYAVTDEADLYAAIDIVKDEIAREILKSKGKRFALARRGGRMVKDALREFPWGLKKFKLKFKKNESLPE
jgi:putative sigma-54 modulation protein